jgi:hypothetical protein
MNITICIQITPLAKGVTTNITDVRTLSNMYMTMSIQNTPLAKGFVTHITDVRTLPVCT